MIRVLATGEFVKAAKLYQKIFNSIENKSFFNWPPNLVLAELEASATWIYEKQNQFLSFISFRETDEALEITALGTDPEFQKQGLLQALFKDLADYAAKQKKALWLEVHAQNQAAIQLYLKQGFVLVRTRKKYYADGGDAWLMNWQKS